MPENLFGKKNHIITVASLKVSKFFIRHQQVGWVWPQSL